MPFCKYWGNNGVFEELKEQGMEKLAESGLLEKLEKLMQKWDELRSKELMEAFSRSERSFEEIMRFLSGNEVDDE